MRFLIAALAALVMFTSTGAVMAQSANVITIRNLALPVAPPDYYLPNASGVVVPTGHTSWIMVFDTTGLPANTDFIFAAVDYHYTNVLLSGSLFTGWIEDCSAPLSTTHLDKLGNTVFSAFFGCDLRRVPDAYPDAARLHILTSAGWPRIAQTTLTLD